MDSSRLTIDLVPTGPRIRDLPFVNHLADNGAESLRSDKLVNDGFGKWHNVVDDEAQSKLVSKATIFSSPVPYWDSYNDSGGDPEHEVMNDWACGEGNEWKAIDEEIGDPEDNFRKLYEGIAKLTNLVNLEHAGLAFMRDCVADEAFEPEYDHLRCAEIERIEYRTEVLQHFFKALSKRREIPEYTPVRTLSITNLQNYPLPELTTSEDFKNVIKEVQHLHLYFAIEVDEHGSKYGAQELWTAMPWLENHWLAPIAGQLKTLELYFAECWGPLPGWFNTKLNFPALEKLVVGNYCFAHSDQLDWILNQKSLKTLHFHSCSITSYIRLARSSVVDWGVRTHEWTERDIKPFGSHERDDICFDYKGTWAEIFDRIQQNLSQIVDFKLINKDEWDHAGYQEVTFGCTDQLETKLVAARYNNYNCGVCPSPWVEEEDISKWSDDKKGWERHYTSRGEVTEAADQEALHSLLKAVAWRRKEKGLQ